MPRSPIFVMDATDDVLSAVGRENVELRARICELEAEIARLRSESTPTPAPASAPAPTFAPRNEREIQFMALAHIAPVLLWTSAPDGLCDYFNQRWLDFTGRSLDQELGNGWAEGVHRDDFDRCLRIYLDHLQARKPFQMEYRLRRHDGEYRWIHDQGAPRYHPDGTFAGFIGSCFDITERRQLEERLLQSQKLEGIGHLAGGMAHEFNNLLTGLMLNLGAARFEGSALARREALDEATATAQRAAELIRQLLAFARRALIRLEPVDLTQCVARERGMLTRLLGEGIRLEVSSAPNLPQALADPHNLSQVLLILCQNARDAMPAGGTVEIELSTLEADAHRVAGWEGARPGRFVVLAVKDSGSGMDAAVRARLFEPFFTTKDVGLGTGLGLAVVRGIAGQHHGGVEVETELGRGSTFRVFLPTTPFDRSAEDPSQAITARRDFALGLDLPET